MSRLALTDKAIKAAHPGPKPRKLFDGGGLHLLVTQAGTKLWRMKYRYGGKEKQLALGAYPKIGLAEARDLVANARRMLASGSDPGAAKKVAKHLSSAVQVETVEAVAREWYIQQAPSWAPRHAEDVIKSLERLVFPAIGSFRLTEVTPPLVLNVVRDIEKRSGGETARRVRQRISAVFVYGVATGRCQTDPAAIIKGALAPLVRGRMPAVTTLSDAREVMRSAEAMPAHPATKAAHRFLALTLVRPDNVHAARWVELGELEGGIVWQLAPERMKTREPHVVPLSRQAVAVVDAMRPFTGRGPFIFPNVRFAHRPMSENALSYLLARAGLVGRHVPHGWRATFSTVMNERFPADADVIERILAHAPSNKVRAAYNRALYLSRRRELLQLWADALLEEAVDIDVVVGGPRRPLRGLESAVM